MQELLVSSLAQTDALAKKLLIEKGIITQQEFLAKISGRASDIPGDARFAPNRLWTMIKAC